MSIEAERIYDAWSDATGQMFAPSSMAIELIDWTLTQAKRHEAEGHRHITHTDREDLARLGYELHQDGGYHQRLSDPLRLIGGTDTPAPG